MNEFLKTREQVDNATKYLQDNGLKESGLSCKNWEVTQVIPYMVDGNWLDMGSDGGVVLENLMKLNIVGDKIGIDLSYHSEDIDFDILFHNGIKLLKRDLMDTKFPDDSFDFISSLSVIEHSVSINKFAKEVSRLLKSSGKAFVSFDYWPEKLNTKGVWLYNLEWSILCKEDVVNLIEEFKNNGLELTSDIDWTIQDAVINSAFCSPVPEISYTFGILNFIKK